MKNKLESLHRCSECGGMLQFMNTVSVDKKNKDLFKCYMCGRLCYVE